MIAELTAFVQENPRLLVITGAGLSAGSGIPTYRDNEGTWLRSDPIQHQDFINKPSSRQRYWARSMVGWPKMSLANPNSGHLALVELEKAGFIKFLVTQNVDCLHQRAGHARVVDLHGSLDRVICLSCATVLPRAQVQDWLIEDNPHIAKVNAEMRPDGDADLADDVIQGLQIRPCPNCSGTLKPDVVFFGGSVPKSRVEQVSAMVNSTDALLVIGSSLMVFSSFRFCRQAHALQKPIALLNQGATRADDLASLKIDLDCTDALQQLQQRLC